MNALLTILNVYKIIIYDYIATCLKLRASLFLMLKNKYITVVFYQRKLKQYVSVRMFSWLI